MPRYLRVEVIMAFVALFAFAISTPVPATPRALKKTRPKLAVSTGEDAALAAIREVNQRFIDAGKRMDSAAVMALWADDAVDLLPGMAPMVGKQTISTWLDGITARFHDNKITEYSMDINEIKIASDWAFEWGATTQTILQPDGKSFDNPGKITLILHRQDDGQWKIRQEMWNANPRAANVH